MSRALLAGLALVGGCWLRGGGGGADDAPADAVITLYRDAASVEERHVIEVGADGVATLPIGGAVLAAPDLLVGVEGAELVQWSRVPAGADGDEVEAAIGDHAVRGRAVGAAGPAGQVIEAADGVHVVRGEVVTGGHAAALRLVTRGARRGAIVTLHYATTRLTWWTSYTLVEDRDGRGRLHGALALDNQAGRRWERARVTVIDRPIGAPGTDETPAIHLPGRFALGSGEQRLDLGLRGGPLALRPTLVYDPVGTRLDAPEKVPRSDPSYGVEPWATRVDESVLIDLTSYGGAPLPAGVVRLLRVDARGELAWRGEGKLLPPSPGARRATAISIGRATDVSGKRTRTMFERDETTKRLVEEFTLRFENQRERPVDVLAREHIYRGTCWMLSYHSTGDRIAKEGSQQIGLGVVVPARGTATIVYRVTYSWDPDYCKPPPSKSPG